MDGLVWMVWCGWSGVDGLVWMVWCGWSGVDGLVRNKCGDYSKCETPRHSTNNKFPFSIMIIYRQSSIIANVSYISLLTMRGKTYLS